MCVSAGNQSTQRELGVEVETPSGEVAAVVFFFTCVHHPSSCFISVQEHIVLI